MAEDELEEYNYEKASQLLADLFDYGLTCAEAVDYLAIEKANIRTKEWSNMRNVMHSTVSSNVRKAKEKVEDRDSS